MGIESGLQSREGELVDSQRAIERMLSKSLDDLPASYDQTCLWPAQQFITAKGNDICSIGNDCRE